MGRYSVPGDLEQFTSSLNLTTLGARSVIDSKEMNPTRQYSFGILLGDPNFYPFDEYYADFFISLQDARNGSNTPLSFGIGNHLS